MKFVSNNGINDPMINLAMEEYVLTSLPKDDSYFLFYINQPSIIVGKNQNTIEEVNQEYVEKHNIKVVRRISGGGAVYHDLGNLNFSFVTKDDEDSFHNFAKFTQPIVDALNEMGVKAKISGNAMVKQKDRMFSHGTLMLNSEIEEVVNALRVNEAKIKSKGIKSIRSRVANIQEFLEEPMDIETFKQRILTSIFKQQGSEDVEEYHLTDEDWDNINELSKNKYQKWEWNYGKNPKYNFERSHKFDRGLVQIKLDVKKGKIEHAAIFGDFFGVGDVKDIEEALIGVQHQKSSIQEAKEEIINLML